MEQKSAWKKYDESGRCRIEEFCDRYKEFLTVSKTERECVDTFTLEAREHGYMDLEDVIRSGKSLKVGDKVYAVNMNKTIALFHIGRQPMEEGMNIVGAHIDSPRLDLKQNPLYEDGSLALFETHYYGGIKKYQWVAQPLSLHGVVAKKDGTVVKVRFGEDPAEPVIGISDLLIHLSAAQLQKKADKVVEGEDLNILVGSIPLIGEEKEPVKKQILKLLKDKYDIEEADFQSAELEAVPAGPARDYGLDASMILGYGHDDRVCAYPSYTAMFAVEAPKRTCVCILVDKEEIGSEGATSMNSDFFKNAVAELVNCLGEYSGLTVKRALANSRMLSSDVTAAYDPLYGEVSEKKNTAYLGRGLAFCKYTGGSGKARSNDANAEYIAALRRVLDEADVRWQMTELGRVGVGGGGTIAKFFASYGMDVIDSGVPVLSMHAPWEVVSKADVYEAYRGYVAFLKNS